MRLLPWDPDVETIISRIDSGALELQPDFQRGEVWSKAKKQRLVDSVLRDWHVPPVHVVEDATSKKQEVLDGQQRLAAIRDFARGEFAVDGSIEPADPSIQRLDGLRYRELPEDERRQFDQFTLRVYRIVDFRSSEPAELFFRLNQPTNLTGAEQRNAFFGPVREQVKELVSLLPSYGLDKDFLGFSNSRMAYDDVLCRVALTLERRSIAIKIGANDLVELYRSEKPLRDDTQRRLHKAIALLGPAGNLTTLRPRFNKATIYSWLIFIVRGLDRAPAELMNADNIAGFMRYFENERMLSGLGMMGAENLSTPTVIPLDRLYVMYDDRSTSRVADVSSILLRDAVIWLAFSEYIRIHAAECIDQLPTKSLIQIITEKTTIDEEVVMEALAQAAWGDLS